MQIGSQCEARRVARWWWALVLCSLPCVRAAGWQSGPLGAGHCPSGRMRLTAVQRSAVQSSAICSHPPLLCCLCTQPLSRLCHEPRASDAQQPDGGQAAEAQRQPAAVAECSGAQSQPQSQPHAHCCCWRAIGTQPLAVAAAAAWRACTRPRLRTAAVAGAGAAGPPSESVGCRAGRATVRTGRARAHAATLT